MPITVLEDSDTDPDELAHVITSAYHRHVEAYLATTYPPADVEQAVASGLLGSPLLGTSTRVTADWCHAWSVLGQWSGLVTFPVPASGVWPRHGHLRRILDGYQGRQSTSTNGLGLPMSKEPFRPLACCRVKSAYEYYRETRCTKP